jgi:hypothetical protein
MRSVIAFRPSFTHPFWPWYLGELNSFRMLTKKLVRESVHCALVSLLPEH